MKDLIIIGSGPAGLSAAVYASRANLDMLVIEKDYEGTGQVALSSKVDNYLGLPGLDGYSMGEKFREHAVSFGVEFVEASVSKLSQNSETKTWTIETSDGQSFESKAIIYATGGSHRKLSVPGEERLSTKGVSYCATCDGAFFRNKTTAVIGGGDTALDDALYLSGLCEKVYIIHRRESFRAAAVTVSKVKEKENIELVLSANVTEILGEDRVSSVTLDNGQTLSLDGIFIATGSVPETSLLENIAELDKSGYVVADETCKTSAVGLFVAGDVRTKKLRQVVTAVADGACAVNSVTQYLQEL